MPTLNKLEYLDETKQQIKNALNTNFDTQIGDNDTFRSYVDKIKNIYENWSKVTGIGTDLTLNNTKNGKMGVIPEGNASQDGDPTPDTPIPIKVVTGEQNVEISGKNLFDKDNANVIDGYISTGNTTLLSNGPNNKLIWINIKNSTTYTISKKVFSSSSRFGIATSVEEPATGISISNAIRENNSNYLTVTSGQNDNYLIVYVWTSNSTYTLEEALNTVQIEEGSVATEYEPYQSQTYPLSLGNIELAKIGNYKDYIFKNVVGSPYYNADLDLNGWYKYKAINKYTFTGNETISVTGDVFYTNNIADNILTSGIICICNRMKAVANTAQGSSVPLNSCCFRPGDYSRFYFNMSSITTVASEIKQYFQENITYVTYHLATPTYEKITDTTLISQLENLNKARSYKGTTIIECTSESDDNEVIVANVSALMKGVQ